MDSPASMLYTPFPLGNITLKNRLLISPMCQYSAEDGFAEDWHLVHLGARAIGGASLILQEATAVSLEGRITYGDLGLWKDEQIDFLRRITTFVHTQGAKIGIQLAHAGRKASCEKPWDGGEQIAASQTNGWTTVGPSTIAFKEGQEPPRELTVEEIQQIVEDFRQATRRAEKAGYDVIEIHAAHGYLLHQFLSPLSNVRKDEYGGIFENRIRLLLEVVASVQAVWGLERPLLVRISATDWVDGGWTVADAERLCAILKDRGVHLIDVSSGGNVIATIPVAPGYQVKFAEQIRRNAQIPTGVVGLITNPEQAEEILQREQADLILIGRESLRNPNFPLYAQHVLEQGTAADWPKQYERAYPTHNEWKRL